MDWIGKVIDGRYRVTGELGSGGMGIVLRARHEFTGAEVALKLLRQDVAFGTEVQERFLAEARAPTSIGHPGIVQVLDAGRTPDGLLYVAMELLAGESLRASIARPLPPPHEVRRIGVELLDALAAAHARHIIHRDLKPENVFLVGPARTVKLLDFGIAKILGAPTSQAFTATGALLGTAAYMAPEQLEDAAGVDARADLWAVGVILYELLTCRTPYRGESIGHVLQSLALSEPDPIRAHLPTATPALEHFFARVLVRDRSRRYTSAREMAEALAAVSLGDDEPPAKIPSTKSGWGGAPALAAGTGVRGGTDVYAATVAPGAPPPPSAPARPQVSQNAQTLDTYAASQPSAPIVARNPQTSAGTDWLDPPTERYAPASAQMPPPPPPVGPAPFAPSDNPFDPPTVRTPHREPLGVIAPTAPIVPINFETPTGMARRAHRDAAPPSSMPVDVPVPGPAHPPMSMPIPGVHHGPQKPKPFVGSPLFVVLVVIGSLAVLGAIGAVLRRAKGSTPSAAEVCQDGCRLAAECGLASTTCAAECKDDFVMRACMRNNDTCSSLATCFLSSGCGGKKPSGTETCGSTLMCQAGCTTKDYSCMCGCMEKLSPDAVQPLAAIDLCVIGCKGDSKCIEAKCAAKRDVCLKSR